MIVYPSYHGEGSDTYEIILEAIVPHVGEMKLLHANIHHPTEKAMEYNRVQVILSKVDLTLELALRTLN